WTAALARLRDVAPDVRRQGERALVDRERRWGELEAFRAEAQALLDEVAALRAAGELARAWRRLEAFLAPRKQTVPDVAIGRAVLAAADEATRACAAAGVDPTLPARDEPPARAAAHAERAREGQARVEALRRTLDEQKGLAAAALREEVERARVASRAKPMSLELVPGFTLADAVLEDYDEQGFALRGASGDDVRWAWDAARLDTALKVRRFGVRADSAEDHVRLGLWAVRRRLFREARRAFRQAATLDAALAGRLPDVDLLERAAAVFQGELERRGTSITLRYGFDREDEAGDFAPALSGARAVVRGGHLEVHGRGLALVQLEMGFNGLADVSVTLGPTGGEAVGAVLGLSFAAGTEREETWIAVVFPRTGDLLLARWRGGGDVEVVQRKPAAARGAGGKLRMVVRRDRVEVMARGRTQASQPIQPLWEKCRVLLGGNGGPASFDDLTVKGRVRTDWLRKSFGEFDAALAAALARADEVPLLARPQGARPEAPLSAEDAWALEGVDAAVLRDYRAAAAQVEAAEEDDLAALTVALQGLNRVVERARGLAPAYYQRARISLAAGLPGVALLDLARAQALAPRFHEAVALEAAALAALGRLDEALSRADAALALRPDAADAWAARGAARFLREEFEGALGDLEVALALDPWDDGARGLVRNVRHVLAGPPWSRRFRVETAHYVLETNISQKRADDYARDLEAVRQIYAQRFGVAGGAPPARKSRVLVFDAEEGYHSYAALTMDDRVESTLGCYLPRYRQLLLFEDKDDTTLEETRQTLFHEGFHQFLHQLVPDNLVPYWLNEGLAEYLSACTVKDGKVVAQGQVLQGRLRDLRAFLRAGGPFPFDKLMKETPREFYSGAVWAKYAQAWAMVHFFEEGPDEDARGRFRRYVAKLREGAAADEAFEAAWKGVRWPDLQRAWRAHVDGL
ncbi:MAG: DUF1570 domain-containing protein, partial [Planctomycetes bacterium]|nr:DUF1570 domain-containing protein [Planctomycetota bacterium]